MAVPIACSKRSVGGKKGNHLLQEVLIYLIEHVELIAVDIQHGNDLPIRFHRHHDLRARGGVAGDMSGKGIHIRHDHRLCSFPSRSTYPFPEEVVLTLPSKYIFSGKSIVLHFLLLLRKTQRQIAQA